MCMEDQHLDAMMEDQMNGGYGNILDGVMPESQFSHDRGNEGFYEEIPDWVIDMEVDRMLEERWEQESA